MIYILDQRADFADRANSWNKVFSEFHNIKNALSDDELQEFGV